MSGYFKREVRVYVVTVAAMQIRHLGAVRFEIPAREYRLYAHARATAVKNAVEEVAREVGLPPWRPWLREVARNTRVVDVVMEEVQM